MSNLYTDNLIPLDAISLVEAYRQLFTAVTPDWETLERNAEEEALAGLSRSGSTTLEYQMAEEGLDLAIAKDSAESTLRTALADGSLTAYERGGNGERLRVMNGVWAEPIVLLGDGIRAEGPCRTIFLLRTEFDPWLKTICYSAVHSGQRGRPNLVSLVKPEFKRQCEAGELEGSWREQASKLISWFGQAFPSLAAPTEKTLRLAFSQDYKKAKDAGKSRK